MLGYGKAHGFVYIKGRDFPILVVLIASDAVVQHLLYYNAQKVGRVLRSRKAGPDYDLHIIVVV